MECEWTSEETKRLFYQPHEIRVTRDSGMAPNNAYIAVLNKLYLSEPVIRGGLSSINALPSYPLIEEMASYLGTYYVFWDIKNDNS